MPCVIECPSIEGEPLGATGMRLGKTRNGLQCFQPLFIGSNWPTQRVEAIREVGAYLGGDDGIDRPKGWLTNRVSKQQNVLNCLRLFPTPSVVSVTMIGRDDRGICVGLIVAKMDPFFGGRGGESALAVVVEFPQQDLVARICGGVDGVREIGELRQGWTFRKRHETNVGNSMLGLRLAAKVVARTGTTVAA